MKLLNKIRVLMSYATLPINYFTDPITFNDKVNLLERLRGFTRLISYPTYFGVNLSPLCNQSCNFCYHDNSRITQNHFIDENLIQKMKWLRFVHNIDLFAGNGETLLNPHFPKIAKAVREITTKSQLSTFTNGLLLNGENLEAILKYFNKVHISLNAIKRETYNHVIRGGNYDLVMKNLEALSERKPPELTVELSMVYMKSTAQDLELMIEYASEHGFKTVTACHYVYLVEQGHRLPVEESISDSEEAARHIHEMEELAKEKGVNLYFPQSLEPPEKCPYPWMAAYITVDLEGYPVLHTCCSGINMDTYLNESSYIEFRKAWNGERMQHIRATANLNELDSTNNMCFFCRQLDRADKHWRTDFIELSKKRCGITIDPHDLPHVFPKETIK